MRRRAKNNIGKKLRKFSSNIERNLWKFSSNIEKNLWRFNSNMGKKSRKFTNDVRGKFKPLKDDVGKKTLQFNKQAKNRMQKFNSPFYHFWIRFFKQAESLIAKLFAPITKLADSFSGRFQKLSKKMEFNRMAILSGADRLGLDTLVEKQAKWYRNNAILRYIVTFFQRIAFFFADFYKKLRLYPVLLHRMMIIAAAAFYILFTVLLGIVDEESPYLFQIIILMEGVAFMVFAVRSTNRTLNMFIGALFLSIPISMHLDPLTFSFSGMPFSFIGYTAAYISILVLMCVYVIKKRELYADSSYPVCIVILNIIPIIFFALTFTVSCMYIEGLSISVRNLPIIAQMILNTSFYGVSESLTYLGIILFSVFQINQKYLQDLEDYELAGWGVSAHRKKLRKKLFVK